VYISACVKICVQMRIVSTCIRKCIWVSTYMYLYADMDTYKHTHTQTHTHAHIKYLSSHNRRSKRDLHTQPPPRAPPVYCGHSVFVYVCVCMCVRQLMFHGKAASSSRTTGLLQRYSERTGASERERARKSERARERARKT